jgi:phospholipid/cholesterol/gamma-HCH transport system substrate-binding protein
VISRRIVVNLVAFIALFVLLCTWAVRNVIRFDAIERPYVVTAEFETSPGLRPDFEVAYLGLRVGNIGKVRLVGDHVEVQLKIDRGERLPGDVTASVRRKSAVGEPYVDLTPIDPETAGVEGPRLTDGDVIPLERTSTPLAYGELFSSLADLVEAIPPGDLGTLIGETAEALEGRGDDIRSILVDTEDLLATIAEDPEALPRIVGELSRLTRTLAEHRDAIGAGIGNVAALSDALADSEADLVALLERGPAFAELTNRMLVESSGELGCTLTGLADVVTALDSVDHLDELSRTMDLAQGVVDVYEAIRYVDADGGVWLDAAFQFADGAGGPVPAYIPPHELPEPGPVPTCDQPDVRRTAGGADGAGGGDTGSPGTTIAERTPSDDVAAPDRPTPAAPASSDQAPSDSLLDHLGTAILALVALAAILAVLAARPWRLIAARRSRDDDA